MQGKVMDRDLVRGSTREQDVLKERRGKCMHSMEKETVKVIQTIKRKRKEYCMEFITGI